jgi:hypothetical protein
MLVISWDGSQHYQWQKGRIQERSEKGENAENCINKTEHVLSVSPPPRNED